MGGKEEEAVGNGPSGAATHLHGVNSGNQFNRREVVS